MRVKINKPIVLIGMMGSGKSTIGKRLAKKLNLQFYDSDKVIEQREGLSVMDIHDFRGEEYFRKKEEEVIKEILSYGTVVISTGGGSFLNEGIRRHIKDTAISIWLSVDLDILHERVSRRNTRPELIGENKKEILASMLAERETVYSDADIVITTGDTDVFFIVDSVMAKLNKFLL